MYDGCNRFLSGTYSYYRTSISHSNINPPGYILLYKINKKQSKVRLDSESREDLRIRTRSGKIRRSHNNVQIFG